MRQWHFKGKQARVECRRQRHDIMPAFLANINMNVHPIQLVGKSHSTSFPQKLSCSSHVGKRPYLLQKGQDVEGLRT